MATQQEENKALREHLESQIKLANTYIEDAERTCLEYRALWLASMDTIANLTQAIKAQAAKVPKPEFKRVPEPVLTGLVLLIIIAAAALIPTGNWAGAFF
jgi:hypothetical protein